MEREGNESVSVCLNQVRSDSLAGTAVPGGHAQDTHTQSIVAVSEVSNGDTVSVDQSQHLLSTLGTSK